jgi:hypothetical protein
MVMLEMEWRSHRMPWRYLGLKVLLWVSLHFWIDLSAFIDVAVFFGEGRFKVFVPATI